jgi:group I intron endonuclease
MSIYSIYKATNKINGKCYIGFATHWPKRKNGHKCCYKTEDNKFYRAIRKHGWNNFEWQLIYQSCDADHTLKIMEPHFIQEYNSYNEGYNSTIGGEGLRGYVFTEEDKKKISEGVKGNKNLLGYKFSEESKRKMSQSKIGQKRSEETKKKMSLSATGKKHSEETKKKIGEASSKRIPWNKGIKWQKKSGKLVV